MKYLINSCLYSDNINPFNVDFYLQLHQYSYLTTDSRWTLPPYDYGHYQEVTFNNVYLFARE